MTDTTSELNPENTADDEVLAEQAAKPAFEEVYASESAYTPSSLDFDARTKRCDGGHRGIA